MEKITNFKAYALDQMREYLIVNDIEVESKEDFTKIYFDMLKSGYFYKADVANELDEVRNIIRDFAKAYEKDKDLLERDLIFMGSRRVLEKMNVNKPKR
jgi:hypothetical protein